jgi:hypothetical protein
MHVSRAKEWKAFNWESKMKELHLELENKTKKLKRQQK